MHRLMTIAAVVLSAVLGATASGQILNQDLKLLPDDGAAGDRFGWSVAIADGVVAVGAIWDDDNGSNSGSAYLFDASTGAQLAKLLPDDGAAGDRFGGSITIGDGIVAVGAPRDDNEFSSGSAYLFDASTGVQIAKLLPDDGAAGDNLGWSIAIADGLVAVGAVFDDDNGSDSGSVYLFNASTGAQIAKLLPDDGAAGDWFGLSIAMAGGLVAVGARLDADNGSSSGSAYLFHASTGDQIAKLLPDDGAAGDNFGTSIAIADGVVTVGDGVVAVRAHLDDNNESDFGSAYLFDASTGAQLAKLLPNDGAADDKFGFSIAIGDGVVAVGAHLDDDNGSGSGSAYLFFDTNPCSPADLAIPFNVLNFDDVLSFLVAFGSMDPAADIAPAFGVFDFDDVLAFLTAFGAGCP